jgi:hypothetical protein
MHVLADDQDIVENLGQLENYMGYMLTVLESCEML